jgi:hypothetical protein
MYQVCRKRLPYLHMHNTNAYRSLSSAGFTLNTKQYTTEHARILLTGWQAALELHAFQYYDRFEGFNPRGLQPSLFSQKKLGTISRYECLLSQNYAKLNSVAWVRERTIPTEWPPLVGKVSAKFCGYRVPRGQRDGSLRPYYRLSRPAYYSTFTKQIIE